MRWLTLLSIILLCSCSTSHQLGLFSVDVAGAEADVREKFRVTYRENQLIRYYDRKGKEAYFLTADKRNIERVFGNLSHVTSLDLNNDVMYRTRCVANGDCDSKDQRFCSREFELSKSLEDRERSEAVHKFVSEGYPLNLITFSDRPSGNYVTVQYFTDCDFLEHDARVVLPIR